MNFKLAFFVFIPSKFYYRLIFANKENRFYARFSDYCRKHDQNMMSTKKTWLRKATMEIFNGIRFIGTSNFADDVREVFRGFPNDFNDGRKFTISPEFPRFFPNFPEWFFARAKSKLLSGIERVLWKSKRNDFNDCDFLLCLFGFSPVFMFFR